MKLLSPLILITFFLVGFSLKLYPNKVDSIKNAIRNSTNEYDKILLLNQVSKEYRRSNLYEESIRAAEEALNLSKWNNYRIGIIEAYMNLGHSYYYYSNYLKALENYLFATNALKKKPDNTTLAKAYINIAQIYNILENPSEAVRYNKSALSILKKTPNDDLLINCYTNFSDSYLLLKDKKNQIDFLKKSIVLRQGRNQIDKVGIEYNNLAFAYWKVNAFDSAFSYFDYYLKTSINLKDSIGIARSYSNMGSVLASKGELSDAIKHFKKSLQIRQSDIKAHTYLQLVDVYCKAGNLKDATYYFHLAEKEKANLQDLAHASYSIASGFKRVNNTEKTIYYLQLSNETNNEFHKVSIEKVESLIKAKYEVEGIEARLAEKENYLLAKENLELQSKQKQFLIIILILTVIIAVGSVYLFRRRLVEKEKKLVFFEEGIQEMGKYLQDIKDLKAKKASL